MDTTYKLTAYNSEAIYVYGSQEDVWAYLDSLNKNRDSNEYGYENMPDEEVTRDIEAVTINLADCFLEVA